MSWPMLSVTRAVTIFTKPVTGRDVLHEERCTFGSHGRMLMSHTFIEIKTRKHFMLFSLHTQTTRCCYAHRIAMRNSLMLPERSLNSVPPTTSIKSTSRAQEGDTDTDNVMCPERCYLFITGKCIPGYSNVAMPSDGGVYTYSISEVQKLTNEPMSLQSIHLAFKYLS